MSQIKTRHLKSMIMLSELTFKIECLNLHNQELEEYVSSIDGVLEIKTFIDTDEVYIKYNSKLVSIKRLVLEVKLFLYLSETPSIIKFDKHSKQKTMSTTIIIDDVCCEYCLKKVIEDLLLLDGIKMANTYFDDINYFNVPIEIKYDKSIFNEKNVKELEIKLNSKRH